MFAFKCLTGSSSVNTRKLMASLRQRGWLGELSAALFRAQKASDRAKGYRAYADYKYDAKDEQVAIVCDLMASSSMTWGWGIDECGYVPNVLYIDLPNGQVSFHSPVRHEGPNYDGTWDASQNTRKNIANFIEDVIRTVEPDGTTVRRKQRPKTTFRCECCQLEKSSSLTLPRKWLWVKHHGDETAVCSPACENELIARLDELYYTADYLLPNGAYQGIRLGDAPEGYLFYCRDKVKQANSLLRQAAKCELVRRYPDAISRRSRKQIWS